jgi:putative sterol carrier protein
MADKVVFAEVKRTLAGDASLVTKINGVFHFDIKDGSGQVKSWTVDCKTPPGNVAEGKVGKADVTIAIAEADFVEMVSGKLTGQQAFMQGKLKMSGNMAFAMKLGQLFEKRSSATGSAAAVAAAPTDEVAFAFSEIGKNMAGDPAMVDRVKGIFQFRVARAGGDEVWTVDLKTAKPGTATKTDQPKPDVTMSFKEADFIDLMTGKLDGQQAFMQGKMKMTGNMALAMKLGQIVNSKVPKSKL